MPLFASSAEGERSVALSDITRTRRARPNNLFTEADRTSVHI